MTSEARIAWLAGIIDGEGCITAKMTSKSAVAFRLTIESVSGAMITSVRDIMNELGVDYWEHKPILRFNSTRPSIRLYVQKKEDLWILCTHILPYSVVKRSELEVVKAYLDKAVGRNYSATEEDLEVLEILRALKRSA